MENYKIIDLTPENIAKYGVCGYKDAKKHKELQNKIDWFKGLYPNGLRIKAAVSSNDEYIGMIEYMPGEIAHRPVNADGYLFIQCFFMGFKKEFKGVGIGSAMLNICIDEAKAANKLGVAVVSRKGSFMASDDVFIKNGFQVVDKSKPDFNLLVLKFNPESQNPSFKENMHQSLENLGDGLVIMRSHQCPYTEKNVNSIIETAKNKFKLNVRLVNLNDTISVQNSPCAFGTFAIIYNGKIISHHPISDTRFQNIMNTLV